MKLAFAGGAMEVGGSCIYLRTDKYGILMDSGIRQGSGKDPIPDFRMIQEMGGVDVILVSHAHMDHIGTLPVIAKAYPSAMIYMTPMTMDLTRVLMLDSLKIMAMQEEEIPHYVQADVEAMMDRIVPLHYQAEKEVLPEVRVTLYPAGHIAGAACILVRTEEGTVLYTGDYCAFLQRTIEGIRLPRLRPDLIITESTYGDKLHSNRQVEEKRLIQLVGDAVRSGSKVLIPSFALGRSQEVILLLRQGIELGEIPHVPVYVDGMVREVNRVYRMHPTYLRGRLAKSIMKGAEPFYTDDIRPVLPTDDRRALLEKEGPAVFVASSGMLSGGPSVLYAEKIAGLENGLILITGYQDEEAPGRVLLNMMEEHGSGGDVPSVTLGGHVVPVRAKIERVGLSAHGDQNEIVNLIASMSAKDVVLVHGEGETIAELAPHISGEHLRGVYVPRPGEVIEVHYRNMRKQVSLMPRENMGESGMPDAQGQRRLWMFVLQHGHGKEMTAVQLAYIWSGKEITEDREISAWQALLQGCVFFAANPYRLFLFHALSEEEVNLALAPKALSQQEVAGILNQYTEGLDVRKVGFRMDTKEVILNFHFPDAVDRESVQKRMKGFTEETGFTVTISPSVNHAAVQQLLISLFADRVLRVSYYENEKAYRVQLAGDETEGDREARKTFREKTGWTLLLGDEQPASARPAGVRAKPGVRAMEQNAAIAYIKNASAGWENPVQKVSIRNDQEGRYFEVSMITPQVYQRYEELFQKLADTVGWRIQPSQAVMQNLVIPLSQNICQKAGITLRKTPSFMPATSSLQLRAEDAPPEAREEAAAEILRKTGLTCCFIE